MPKNKNSSLKLFIATTGAISEERRECKEWQSRYVVLAGVTHNQYADSTEEPDNPLSGREHDGGHCFGVSFKSFMSFMWKRSFVRLTPEEP